MWKIKGGMQNAHVYERFESFMTWEMVLADCDYRLRCQWLRIMMLLSTQGLHCTLQMRIDRCVYSERHNLLCYKSSRKNLLCVWNMEKMYNRASLSPPPPRSGELWTQKLKPHLVRTQHLNVLPLKPWVGQYIVIHATLTAQNFFLAYFYPSGPFTCIVSKTSSDFFPASAVANTGSRVGSQNKIGQPVGCSSRV